MSTLNSKWYAGLRADLTKEIKLAVRIECRKGKTGWGTVAEPAAKASVKKSVIHPIFAMFAAPDEQMGRSFSRHAEVVEEKMVRQELGMSLWSDDHPDTESFEGTSLSQSESEMIGKLLKVVDETKRESLTK